MLRVVYHILDSVPFAEKIIPDFKEIGVMDIIVITIIIQIQL